MTVLSRAKRDAAWPVFEEYRGQLASRKLKEVDDAYREISELLANEIEQGKYSTRYSAIVVDETQDFGPQALRLLRAIIPNDNNDLFFVGDGHQRIYTRNRAAMSRCGIDIRGRARKLYLNYRTTDEIRRQAVALLEGCEVDDLDDGHDETRRYKSLSHGPKPIVLRVDGMEAAVANALDCVRRWLVPDKNGYRGTSCVIAHSQAVRDMLARQFTSAGIAATVIDAHHKAPVTDGAVCLSTMHRAKGLEFDHVVVVAPTAFLGDLVETVGQRKLLYVALTRAKREAVLLTT